jgi:hypothetical protein
MFGVTSRQTSAGSIAVSRLFSQSSKSLASAENRFSVRVILATAWSGVPVAPAATAIRPGEDLAALIAIPCCHKKVVDDLPTGATNRRIHASYHAVGYVIAGPTFLTRVFCGSGTDRDGDRHDGSRSRMLRFPIGYSFIDLMTRKLG